MKYLELTEFTPPAGKEYMADSYPGIGNYLLPSGMIALVYRPPNTSIPSAMFIQPGVKVEESAPAAAQSIDVHRMLDQMIKLAK